MDRRSAAHALLLSLICVSGVALGCAATAPAGDGVAAGKEASPAGAPVAIRLTNEVTLTESPTDPARSFLDVTDRPEALPTLLDGIVADLAEAVMRDLPTSDKVRWVITEPNPRLTPDHELHIRLLRFTVQSWGELLRPGLDLHVALSRIDDGVQIFTQQVELSSTVVERRPGEKSALDLSLFHAQIAGKIRAVVEQQLR